MAQVTQCNWEEGVRLDSDRIIALYAKLGPAGAEQLISATMEDLAVQLSIVERLVRTGSGDELRMAIEGLLPLARQVGLPMLARVARDLIDCVQQENGPATAAVLARLMRIGDRGLTAVWDLADMGV
ncbi:MAG: hypothetical protein R3D78_09880 [Paracoccaceae bacterium]